MNQDFTLQRFNRLTTEDQYDALEQHGVYLKAFRIKRPFKITLFSLCSFYVEVWLNQASDELKKAFAFNDYKRLDPFLPSVDISPVYSLLGRSMR